MTEKQAEKLALPIIGIVLGTLGLLLSWVPIINNFAFVLAIIALILTGISFLVNRKGTKTLTYISLGLAIATGAIVLMTQASYSKALDSVSKDIKTSTSTSSKSGDVSVSTDVDLSNKNWSQADYDALKAGDTLTGEGGDTLKKVEEKFGKPTVSSDVSAMGHSVKSMGWTNTNGKETSSITLQFVEQDNGDWLLSTKSQAKSN